MDSTQFQLKDTNATYDAIETHPQAETFTTKECRICLSSELQDQLITPCECTGSVKYVHKNCLKEWLEIKAVRDSQDVQEDSLGVSCQLCKYVIQVSVELRHVCNTIQQMKQQIGNKLLVFLFSTIAIICSISLLMYTIWFLSAQVKRGYSSVPIYERAVVLLSIIINIALITYHTYSLKGYFSHKKAEINFKQKANNNS